MATRIAVLLGERDERLGSTRVTDSVRIITYCGALYVQTENGVRLKGGGVGVIYEACDPAVRNRLDPV